jgi:hypothetical protein
MGAGYDHEEFTKHWKGGLEVLRGNKIYNPLTGEYVPAEVSEIPEPARTNLSEPGPNNIEARLAHIQALFNAGKIDAEEAEEARRRILQDA